MSPPLGTVCFLALVCCLELVSKPWFHKIETFCHWQNFCSFAGFQICLLLITEQVWSLLKSLWIMKEWQVMNFEFRQTHYKWYDPTCVSHPKVSLKILVVEYLFNVFLIFVILLTAVSLLLCPQKLSSDDHLWKAECAFVDLCSCSLQDNC